MSSPHLWKVRNACQMPIWHIVQSQIHHRRLYVYNKSRITSGLNVQFNTFCCLFRQKYLKNYLQRVIFMSSPHLWQVRHACQMPLWHIVQFQIHHRRLYIQQKQKYRWFKCSITRFAAYLSIQAEISQKLLPACHFHVIATPLAGLTCIPNTFLAYSIVPNTPHKTLHTTKVELQVV